MNPWAVTAASRRARSARFGASAVSRDGVRVILPGHFPKHQRGWVAVVENRVSLHAVRDEHERGVEKPLREHRGRIPPAADRARSIVSDCGTIRCVCATHNGSFPDPCHFENYKASRKVCASSSGVSPTGLAFMLLALAALAARSATCSSRRPYSRSRGMGRSATSF